MPLSYSVRHEWSVVGLVGGNQNGLHDLYKKEDITTHKETKMNHGQCLKLFKKKLANALQRWFMFSI